NKGGRMPELLEVDDATQSIAFSQVRSLMLFNPDQRVTETEGFTTLYERPAFTNDPRLFNDLPAYAPGLNTSTDDVEAVLDREAAPELRSSRGQIDPAARRLIDAARSHGWQTITASDAKGRQDSALSFDGAGRYVCERTLPTGLRE